MTHAELRKVLTAHIRQPSYQRNSAHAVVAIYLGRDEFYSLLDERVLGYSLLQLREGGVTFGGVPVFEVAERSHVRIVSEHKPV